MDSRTGSVRGLVEDAVLLLLGALLFPLVIVVIGTPVALLVKVLAAIARLAA
jgi:hypothetical protein